MADLKYPICNLSTGGGMGIDRGRDYASQYVSFNYYQCTICGNTSTNVCPLCSIKVYFCTYCFSIHQHDENKILRCTCGAASSHSHYLSTHCAASLGYYTRIGLSEEKWELDEIYRKERSNNTILTDIGLLAWKNLSFVARGEFLPGLYSRNYTPWKFNEPVKAVGEMNPFEISPGPGIYSHSKAVSHRTLSDSAAIIAKIRIWGRVFQYSEGYKSEYAMLDTIYSERIDVREFFPQTKSLVELNLDEDFDLNGSYLNKCNSCGQLIFLTPEQMQWFLVKNFQPPKKCKQCSIQQKAARRLADIYKEKKGEKR